jgi:hypothetical protein
MKYPLPTVRLAPSNKKCETEQTAFEKAKEEVEE